jgi:hypothetical protein
MRLANLASLALFLGASAAQDPDDLMPRLIGAINAGKLPGKSDATRDGFKDGEKRVAWSDLDAPARFRLLEAIDLKDDALLSLARWAWTAGLKKEAEAVLARHVEADPKGRKPGADRTVAGWRGIPVPEGGFSYDPRAGWETLRERASRKARARAAELCQALSTADDPKILEPAAAELAALARTAGLPAATSEAIKAEGSAALQALLDRRLKAVEARASGPEAAPLAQKLRDEIARRRQAALTVILDPAAYSSKEEKMDGQDKVDRLVLREHPGSLGELWHSAGDALVSLDPVLKGEVDLLRGILGKHLPALGAGSEEGRKALDGTIRKLGEQVRGPGPGEKERERHEYNLRVEAYNRAFSDPDATAEVKEHVRIMNDYREMMGFRRLYLDARLCRAAKKHSAACDKAGKIWHVGPDGDPQTRARREGFPDKVAENVGIKYASPADIWWQGWFRSSDHHRIALAEAWTCMGYGYVGIAGTQTFSATALPSDFPR